MRRRDADSERCGHDQAPQGWSAATWTERTIADDAERLAYPSAPGEKWIDVMRGNNADRVAEWVYDFAPIGTPVVSH